MKFRVFPHGSGSGWDLDVAPSYEGEKDELLEPPYSSPAAARRAVRTMKSKIAAGPIEVLEERPADAHEEEV